MQPKVSSRTLAVLAGLFIVLFSFVFSYNGLSAPFTFDDGMNLDAMHHVWDSSIWRNIFDCLKVFTVAPRPLGALFYRPMYAMFGFNPLPFRIGVYVLLAINMLLAWRFVKRLGATGEVMALAMLLFCYNASFFELYYNTGTIYDILCFTTYFAALLVYMRERASGRGLRWRTMAVVTVLFLASLDAKEMSVVLPFALALYEVLFRYHELKPGTLLVRVGGFIAFLGVLTAIFLKVKVAELSNNHLYAPRPSVEYVFKGIGHYFEQLFYLKPDSVGAIAASVIVGMLLVVAAAMRSKPAIYGILFFVVGLIPVAIIPYRAGYAAYIPYPGLTLAIGIMLASSRADLVRRLRKESVEQWSMVALFLLVAFVSVMSFAHYRKIIMGNYLWNDERMVSLLRCFKREIPEFPPEGRFLIVNDPWGPDWGPMFLLRLLYHDKSVWIDRLANKDSAGPRESYDLLVSFEQPLSEMPAKRILNMKMNWEIRAKTYKEGRLTLTSPTADRGPRNVTFAPSASRTGRPVVVTVPGLANIKIDAVYRVLSDGTSRVEVAKGWCSLDDKGSCTIVAPEVRQSGALAVDWVRRPGERWIFTNGVLPIVE